MLSSLSSVLLYGLIAISTFSDWLKLIGAPVFSTNEKQNQNQAQLVRAIFPAL